MKQTPPLRQRLESLIDTDYLAALQRESDMELESRSLDTTWKPWKARLARQPLLAYLDKLGMDASTNGTRHTKASLFALGMQLGYGAFVELAEREAAKGAPELREALARLECGQFKADLPELRRVTLRNLVGWRSKYPPFLMGFRISCSCHRAARERAVANLAVYDGLFAMTAWVVLAVCRQEAAEGHPR